MSRSLNFPKMAKHAVGRVIEVLGFPDDFGVDVEIIIRKHHLPHRVSGRSLEQARRIPHDISRRRDSPPPRFPHTSTLSRSMAKRRAISMMLSGWSICPTAISPCRCILPT